MVKIWNFAKDRGHENFQFLTKFWSNLKLPEIVQINKKTLYNTILRPAIHSQVRNDNVQKVVKIWNFAKDRGHENFQFLTKFWLNLKLPEIVQINKRTLYNTIFRPAIHSQVRNDNVQKVVKIWNFAKDRGHENFQFLTKFWLNLKLPEILQINKRTL